MNLNQWTFFLCVFHLLLNFTENTVLPNTNENEIETQDDDYQEDSSGREDSSLQVSKQQSDFYEEETSKWKRTFLDDIDNDVFKEVKTVMDPTIPENKVKLGILEEKVAAVVKSGEDIEQMKKEATELQAATLKQTHEDFKVLQSITASITKNTPDLIKKIKKGDTWGSIATVSTMLSGIVGAIPHPAATFAATVLSLASFFITLATSSKVEKKKDPYKKIYEEIEKAVKVITENDRKIALARLIAPLALAQAVNTRFLSRSAKQFNNDEFTIWAMSNNFPSLDMFVEILSQISTYVQVLQKGIEKDNHQQTFLVTYSRIAMIRDVLFGYIIQIIPKVMSKQNVTKPVDVDNALPNAKPEFEVVEEDFDKFASLRAEYQRSLNEQKETAFHFLGKLHNPTPESMKLVGWYFPPAQDENMAVLHTYLSGLSYVDAGQKIRFLPPAQLDPELMSLMKFKIWVKKKEWIYIKDLALRDAKMQKIKDTYTLRSTPGEIGQVFSKHHFKFTLDTNGYTRITFHQEEMDRTELPRFPRDTYDKLMKVNGYRLRYTSWEYKVHVPTEKLDPESSELFRVIPHKIYENSDGDKDILPVMLGIKPVKEGDKERYLRTYWDVEMQPIAKGLPGVMNLVVLNLNDIKKKLKKRYVDFEGLGDLGHNTRELLKRLEFCRLVAKCKVNDVLNAVSE